MKKLAILLLSVNIFFWFSFDGIAKFYKYQDADGQVLYTDDLSKVPEDQRTQVDSYIELNPGLQKTVNSANKDSQNSAETDADQTDQEEFDDVDSHKKYLEEKKKNLDLEYQTLMKEKGTLDSSKKNITKKAEIIEYNKKIADFNVKIQTYEKNRQELAEKISEYNIMIKKQISAPKSP